MQSEGNISTLGRRSPPSVTLRPRDITSHTRTPAAPGARSHSTMLRRPWSAVRLRSRPQARAYGG